MEYLPLPDTENGLVAYKVIRCCIVFFVGGVVHMGGDKMLTGRMTLGWSFLFFILQPLGIAFESLVCYLWDLSQGTQQPSSNTSIPRQRKVNGSGRDQVNNPRRFSMESRIEMRDESDAPLWIRCIGHIWVAIWFTWTAAYFINPMCAMDMFSDPRLTRSTTW